MLPVEVAASYLTATMEQFITPYNQYTVPMEWTGREMPRSSADDLMRSEAKQHLHPPASAARLRLSRCRRRLRVDSNIGAGRDALNGCFHRVGQSMRLVQSLIAVHQHMRIDEKLRP
jgi:hypothetical protein